MLLLLLLLLLLLPLVVPSVVDASHSLTSLVSSRLSSVPVTYVEALRVGLRAEDPHTTPVAKLLQPHLLTYRTGVLTLVVGALLLLLARFFVRERKRSAAADSAVEVRKDLPPALERIDEVVSLELPDPQLGHRGPVDQHSLQPVRAA